MRRHLQHAFSNRDGDQPVRTGELHRHLVDEVARHPDALEAWPELHAEEVSEELQTLGFGQEVLGDQNLIEAQPAFVFGGESIVDLDLGQPRLAQEPFANSILQHGHEITGLGWESRDRWA